MTEALEAIADRFHPREQITAIRSLGSGNVNETFLVTHEGSSETSHFVMQRLNTAVFERPDLVMRNLQALGEHIDRRLPLHHRSSRAVAGKSHGLCAAAAKSRHGLSTTVSFGARSLISAPHPPVMKFRIVAVPMSWVTGSACSTT